ncbi:Replication protein A 70 kDa DNA-binding subunit [Bienertia sinuspersici]
MKTEYVLVDKLTPKNKKYKIKAKVTEKSPAKTPLGKKIFQKLVFEDDQGNKIRGTLFEDEIDHFKHVLEHKKEHIIADAPVRNTHPLYRAREGDYFLSFGGTTVIHPIEPNPGPVLPMYTSVAEVPPTSTKNERYGLVISLYKDLATKDCTKLAAWCESFMVVSFLHLQPAAHKGFSLSSSMSTTINSQPTGPEVNALKAWILENKDMLADHVAHELQIREALSQIS